MWETEVKLELMAPGALRDALRSAGAKPLGTVAQWDTYFQHPARDLAASDEAFRLRHENGRVELTYKGPRQAGDQKVRREHNLAIRGDQDEATALLEALGFQPAARVEKRRERYLVSDAPRVELYLDDVTGLGRFVEIEVVGDDLEAAAAAVEDWVKALGLAGAQRHSASYLELLLAAGVDVGAAQAST